MNLNALGRAASGNGGSGVWVDGVELFGPTAGFSCWRLPNRVLYQSAAAKLRECDPAGANDISVDPRGGAPVFAANGYWAAYTTALGTFTSWGLNLTDAAPLGMAPNGTLFVTTYQSQDDIRVYPPGAMAPVYRIADARPLVSLSTTAGHLSALSAGQFVWVDQSLQLRAYGLPTPAQVDEPVRFPTLLQRAPGVYLVLYTTQNGRLIAHPLTDASAGWLFGTGELFGFTGWLPEDGILEGCWTGNEGEAGAVSRARVPLSAPSPLPARPPVDLPTIEPFAYPCYVGFSWVPSGKAAPGNCQVLTPMAGEAQQDWRAMADPSRGVFAGAGTISISRPPKLFGQIGTIEGAGPTYNYRDSAEFWAYIQGCIFYGTRPTFADDGEPYAYPQGILERLPEWGLPVIECYPLPGETPDQTIARLDRKVLDLQGRWSGVFGVVVPTYTQQNAWAKACVLAILARVPYWVRQAKGRLVFVWILPFDRNGPGGPNEDPDMREMGARVAAAGIVCGEPELPPIGVTPPVHNPVPDPVPSPTPPVTPPAPQPEPPEEEIPMTVGQKGMFRQWNATAGPWKKAIVAAHQDAGFVALAIDGGFQSFNEDDGTPLSAPAASPGSWERATFDGKNILVARPGDKGAATAYEWVNL